MVLPKLNIPTTEPKTVRILTLDGGGVRGYSSLLILREVSRQFDERLYGPNHGNKRLLPQISELFDIVVGTSTGGLIALMLVNLNLSVDDCIKQYKVLSRQIFEKKRPLHKRLFGTQTDCGWDHSKYSGKKLRKFIVSLLQQNDFDKDRTLRKMPSRAADKTPHGTTDNRRASSPTEKTSPIVICSVVCRQKKHKRRLGDPVFLCSHKQTPDKPNGDTPCYNCKVADAGRATSAAPTFFSPLEIAGMTLVDGGYGGTNNPSQVALEHYREVTRQISLDDHVMMLNIGTGTKPETTQEPKQSFLRRLIPDFVNDRLYVLSDVLELLTDSEEVAKRLKYRADVTEKGQLKFCRLSADTGVGSLGLDDHARVNDETETGMRKMTEAYLEKEHVQKTITTLVDGLVHVYKTQRKQRRATQQSVVEELGQSPSARNSPLALDLPIPLHNIQSPRSASSNSNPGLLGPSIATDETDVAPRTPPHSLSQGESCVEVIDPEFDRTEIGAQFDSPKPSRHIWKPVQRVAARISTFPPLTKSALFER
ncbi:hypothetical protein H2200_003356 [Cladophialophora chaetospira]|uniref:PNPLA domain-containing protein n=1 Tax=Cladophialophora chaetospira TaxID=386627 RepID=A0AA39CLC6_9EURO|nr:hypothetical protein H2200_003356 [Cladophialophora chaetospira]